MQCELCGREVKDIFKTRVEGVDMNVCENCAKFGVTPKGYSRMPKAAFTVNQEKKEKPQKRPKKDMFDSLKTIVEEYGTTIKEAREKRKMTLEDLAKAVGIKESLLHKIERNEIEPEEKHVRLLERELKISLYEEGTISFEEKDENAEFTLGDFVKIKKR